MVGSSNLPWPTSACDKMADKKNIAKERIDILLDLAEKEFPKHPERSKRYLQLVDKIRMKVNLRLTKEQKKRFCKKCHACWIKGKNLEIKKGKPDIYICKVCGAERKL